MTTLRDIALSFIPPAVFIAVRHLKKQPVSPVGYEPRSTFAEADKEAGVGYENPALLSAFHTGPVDLSSVSDFTAPLLASVAAASIKAKGAKIRVLDFGGASGYLRSYVNTFFDNSIATDWTIVETPSQVRFAGDLGMDDVRYSTEVSGRFDLAIFSGSLHYVSDWQEILGSVSAGMIYIARSPIGEVEQSYIQRGLHDGTPFKYAGRILPRDELFNILQKTHKLLTLWRLDHHMLEMGVHSAPAMLWERRPLGGSFEG